MNQALYQQEMFLARHRQLLRHQQEIQRQRQRHTDPFHGQRALRPPPPAPQQQLAPAPMSSHAFQQQVQQCFNKLPEAHKRIVINMAAADRNQVLSDLVRNELLKQRYQHQAIQEFHQAAPNLQRMIPNPSGLNQISREQKDTAAVVQHHQGQPVAAVSRMTLNQPHVRNLNNAPVGFKTETALPGVVIEQRLSGRPVTLGIVQNSFRHLPGVQHAIAPQQGYLLTPGQSAVSPLNPSHQSPQSLSVVRTNGATPVRQSHESALPHMGGGPSHNLGGVIVPVSSSPKLGSSLGGGQNSAQLSGNTGTNNQSGQGIVKV